MNEEHFYSATDAASQAKLAELERDGEITRTGMYELGDDGNHFPVYVEVPLAYTAMKDLERSGRIVQTGEFRSCGDGRYWPIYVAADHIVATLNRIPPKRKLVVEIWEGLLVVTEAANLELVESRLSEAFQPYDSVRLRTGPFARAEGTVRFQVVEADPQGESQASREERRT